MRRELNAFKDMTKAEDTHKPSKQILAHSGYAVSWSSVVQEGPSPSTIQRCNAGCKRLDAEASTTKIKTKNRLRKLIRQEELAWKQDLNDRRVNQARFLRMRWHYRAYRSVWSLLDMNPSLHAASTVHRESFTIVFHAVSNALDLECAEDLVLDCFHHFCSRVKCSSIASELRVIHVVFSSDYRYRHAGGEARTPRPAILQLPEAPMRQFNLALLAQDRSCFLHALSPRMNCLTILQHAYPRSVGTFPLASQRQYETSAMYR